MEPPQEQIDYIGGGRRALGLGSDFFLRALDVLAGGELEGEAPLVGGREQRNASDVAQVHADRIIDELRALGVFAELLRISFGPRRAAAALVDGGGDGSCRGLCGLGFRLVGVGRYDR